MQSIPISMTYYHALLMVVCSIWCLSVKLSLADTGSRLWLKYDRIADYAVLQSYQQRLITIDVRGSSLTLDAAKTELHRGLHGLIGFPTATGSSTGIDSSTLVVATFDKLPGYCRRQFSQDELRRVGEEGYIIREIASKSPSPIVITANHDIGILYGVFHFLRLLQTHDSLSGVTISSSPKLQWRMLNHWDNLDRSVERGYAGLSIWDWQRLPDTLSQRYVDYARANASIGINGVVLNNVNASPTILTPAYLSKVAALADVFRPYGIHVFLSVNFASPKVLGSLETADPLDASVRQWWHNKIDEIYRLIPDFGGFLVKANSEGQPGPQEYNRTHVDGANMLATPLAEHNGLLIWRAFVYEARGNDRVKDAYDEFVEFDGAFLPNVFIQTKNGPLDFQPREPFSPLLGAMPNTPQMLEFQITQEYLGFSTHLVYLATLYKEVLDADTYISGKNATVARVIDGSLQGQQITGMAGVSNVGNVVNWTHHPFGQANWYALGRLAWDYRLSASQIASEWIKMTLTTDKSAVQTILAMMMESREHLVNYQTPLGLNVLSSVGHHYGPQPWKRTAYHRADADGIGFDRTPSGSNAVAQYSPVVRDSFADLERCPELFLTWFHHIPWDYRMASGRTFWKELCHRYHGGVEGVRQMQRDWASLVGEIDSETFQRVDRLLAVQEDEAVWWRDACLSYFADISGRRVPEHYEVPRYSNEQLQEKEQKTRYMKHFSKVMDDNP